MRLHEIEGRQPFNIAAMRRYAATPGVDLKLIREKLPLSTLDDLDGNLPSVQLVMITSHVKGAGAECLRKLTAYADEHQINLFGWLDDDGREGAGLLAYYEQFGFKTANLDADTIVRAPQPRQ